MPHLGMALSSTVFTFEVDLSDSGRGVYEHLAMRVARHPSESDEFLVARVLAYCLEFAPGIDFSAGLSTPDEPPLAVRDLTGRMHAWIDIGTPSVERLHRASKAAPRVAVYVHKEHAQWLGALRVAAVPRAAAIEVFAIDRALIGAVVARLERRTSFALSAAEGDLFISYDDGTVSGSVTRLAL